MPDAIWNYSRHGGLSGAVAVPSGYVYDPDTLSMVTMRQPVINTDTLTVTFVTPLSVTGPLTDTQLRASAVTIAISGLVPLVASGQVSSSGNNTLLTPAAGKKLRLFYLSYNPLLAVEAAFRFGASGSLFLRNNLVANSVVAKEFGMSRYLEGAVDEALILNLSLAVNVIWNAFYSEV